MIYNLRHTLPTDIPRILSIIADARLQLKDLGIDQWQNGYPNGDVIQQDIEAGHSYVLVDKNDSVLATVMISFDGEPTYSRIEGEWLTDHPYAVIHRLAVADTMKGFGIAGVILEKVNDLSLERGIKSIRIDTHQGNLPMQRCAAKAGFSYCGIITLADGGLRNAYEKETGADLQSESFTNRP